MWKIIKMMRRLLYLLLCFCHIYSMEYRDSSEPRVVYENGVPYLADQNMNPVIDSMGEKIISYSRIIDDRKEAHKKEKKAWYQRWIFCCCK